MIGSLQTSVNIGWEPGENATEAKVKKECIPLTILKYPLFVSDIDGTLINRVKKIPDANKQNLATYRQHGGLFTLATGRSYIEAKHFIKELQIQLPVILCNGALIYDPSTDVLSPMATMERELVFDTLTELKKWEVLDIFVYTLDRVYATGISSHSRSAIEVKEFPLELIDTFDHIPQVPLIKLVAVAKEEAMQPFRQWMRQVNYPGELVQSADNYFEILPSNVSKGNAVQSLAEKLNLTIEQCAVIGDHLNDLSMVEVAGISAAVANAHSKLIQAARHVMPSNEDAGVAHFIRHHLLTTIPQAQGQ